MPYKSPNSQELLSAWDKCILAKFAPGTIDAPIVAAMNVSPYPTMISSTSGSENRADKFGSGPQPMGTFDYVLIAYSPVLSSFYGNGAASNFPVTTKIGGLVYQQSSTLSDVALWQDRFEDVSAGRSMSAVYGSDM